jgi:hypothetical protein
LGNSPETDRIGGSAGGGAEAKWELWWGLCSRKVSLLSVLEVAVRRPRVESDNTSASLSNTVRLFSSR